MCAAGVAILLSSDTPDLLWFSPYSQLLTVIYIVSMGVIFQHEKAQLPVEDDNMAVSSNTIGIKRVLSIYSIHALIVTSAALFLPHFGETIAAKTGLSDSFFGTLFLAITTSLPELVISISAIRIGALDMAMGNLSVAMYLTFLS